MRNSLLLSLLPGVALGVAAALAGCGDRAESAAPDGRLDVVATTNIVADLVREIGGEYVNAEALMGPGVDPHLYKASEGDVARLTEADAIFYNGLDLEGKMADVLERLGDRAVAVTDGLDRGVLLAPPEYEGNHDPHVWMSVGLWAEVAGYVGERLAELDPEHAAAYRQRAEAVVAELEALDAEVRGEIERVPGSQRVLVTAHDAFNYFGRAYDFEVRGLQGISTATEAGTADVQDLAAFVAEREIPALFVESSVSPRSIEAVREAVRARGFEVEIGGNLYSDALGGPESGADTYAGMIRHNVSTIVDALAPESVAVVE